MAITWANVSGVAPELANMPAAVQTQILAVVGRQIDPDIWGSFADDGATYLAAHLATLARLRGTDLVTSERVGPISRSYMTLRGRDPSLSMTTYGVEYERLLGIAVGPAVFVP